MAFQPMPLSRRPAPFDHPDWIFELKLDGFRALAVIQNSRCELISRNGHPFNSFTELRKELTAPGGKTVLDGEIVCLDRSKYCRSVNRRCDDEAISSLSRSSPPLLTFAPS